VPDDGGQDNRYVWIKHTDVADAAASITNFTHHYREETETDQTLVWPAQEVEVDSSSQVNIRWSGGTDNTGLIYMTGFRFIR
jgi:hypothetical protein